MTSAPAWAWAAAVSVICCLLAIDMLTTRRQPGLSRTVLLSAAWVGAGIGFGLVLILWQGIPVSEDYDGSRFVTRVGGKRVAKPLLVAIETTDLIFALDSIPAAFGVTTDAFIVFTSNAFAVLGLRALYFVLAGALERFTYLSRGLAVMLVFTGAKMIIAPVVHVPTPVSLGGIIVILAGAVGMSMWKRPRVAHLGPTGTLGPARPDRSGSHA